MVVLFRGGVVFLLSSLPMVLSAQVDSVQVLEEVTISAYQAARPLMNVGAAISVVRERDFFRFAPTNLVPVLNTVAGVRMEERSPGSYRFSIRGSTLRSPFGVRNVKFYWNGMPFTDAGGNTYLNLFDFSAITNLEIIKGPGSSLYGAGTGGVVLLNTKSDGDEAVSVSATAGSFGLQRYDAQVNLETGQWRYSGGMARQQSDGYRNQSALGRTNVYTTVVFRPNLNHSLNASILFSSLNYQNPGGLTLAQFEEDPQQARPATATIAGAEQQNARVKNNTTYVGLKHEAKWNDQWNSITGLFGFVSDFTNAAIRNYEERSEYNGGLRHETSYSFGKARAGKLVVGTEIQFFDSDVLVSGNDGGQKTNQVFTNNNLGAAQYLLFLQGEYVIDNKWFLTAGSSFNFLRYSNSNLVTGTETKRTLANEFSPRLSVLRRINKNHSVFVNVSRGFSPPTFAEALPSTGVYNTDLNAERGVSYELGARGKLWKTLEYDVALYDFRLKDAIVIQRAADGAEFFVNAGSTIQQGIETSLRWRKKIANGIVKSVALWGALTLNDYKFDDYEQNGNNFSGNPVTGVAPVIVTSGVDVLIGNGFYVNVTSNYTDRIPLNDAADAYADAYFLLGTKAAYTGEMGKIRFEIFAGIDNATNVRYSLGNDLNAVGGRYYNAAPTRNYFAGIKFGLISQP